MFRFYICADKIMQQKIRKVCTTHMNEEKMQYEVVIGNQWKQLATYEEVIDVLILDIGMLKKDWNQVKNCLIELHGETNIIFLTDYQERIVETFGLKIFGLVNKKFCDIELNKIISSLKQQLCYCRKYLIDEKYDSREIAYIKAEHVYSKIVTKQGECYLYREKISKLESDLKEFDFIRTHRSYLVNMREIRGDIGKDIVVCTWNIPVSVRMKSKVEIAYRAFCGKKDKDLYQL